MGCLRQKHWLETTQTEMNNFIRFRSLLLTLLLLGASAHTAFAQQHAGLQTTSFTVTGSGNVLNLQGSGINYHQITWNKSGTLNTCSVKVEQSAIGSGGWSDLIVDQTCTSNGQSAVTLGVPNYIRVTGTIGTGGGTLTATWTGYRAFPSGVGGPLINPPSKLYVNQDEQLFVRVHSTLTNATATVATRLLRARDGFITNTNDSFTVTADGDPHDFAVQLEEGYLLGAIVVNLGARAQRGQLFVELGLINGSTAGTGLTPQLFLADYVSFSQPIGWPGGFIRSMEEGPGFLRSFQSAAPGAGADFIITVPTNRRWRICSLRAVLVTAAAVANRTTQLNIDDGANFYAVVGPNQVQAASLTRGYTFASGLLNAVTTATEFQAAMPSNLVLPQGHRLTSTTVNLQAADAWGVQQLLVEEWIEPH